MNDPLLVRVLHGFANLNEKFEPFLGGQIILVAVIGDFDAAHQFHDEVRPAGFRGAAVQHLGNVWMIHQCNGLAFCFKPRDDLTSVHSQLDDF